MRQVLMALAAAGVMFTTATTTAQAAPLAGSAAIGGAVDSMSPLDTVQARVFAGNRYCFAFDGWRGPGWYRCGFAWRRGLGWGGPSGWHGWRVARGRPGIDRRGDMRSGRVGIDRRGSMTTGRGGVERRGMESDTRSGVRGRATIQQRGTTGTGVRSRDTTQPGTTGTSPGGSRVAPSSPSGSRMAPASPGGGGRSAPAAPGGGSRSGEGER